jgi:hypothetical protein
MSENQSRRSARRIATDASDAQGVALAEWVRELLNIRASNLSTFQKGKRALEVTLKSKVVWPAAKIVARETKRLTWDERDHKSRWGLVGAVTGMLVFGGQGAGIAACRWGCRPASF